MADKNLLARLASLSIRQLREVARSLGVSRYSTANREGLAEAIAGSPDAGVDAEAIEAANLAAIEAEMAPAGRPAATTRVVFLPRDPQWAYVFWDISEADRQQAVAAGGSQLCLRVADVTGMAAGSAHPHTLQEVVVEPSASEWYLPVPLCDRDYRVELGYRKAAGGWISLAFSSVARVPSLHPSELILDQFVPFSLEAGPDVAAAAAIAAAPSTGLHERVYQSATSGWRRLGRGSEAFHELDQAALAGEGEGFSASAAGLWASGLSASGAGLAARQRSFWLVADAELIVYGATDPSARLSIGGEDVPLSPDGTFRIQVPFRDGQQLYPIEAIAADGEQRRNITLEFRRTTPEANVNSREAAVPEWF